jgi:hypothetical protein
MDEFHRQIADQQRKAGVRVITPPHALGFLDPNLPEKSRPLEPAADTVPTAETARVSS